MNEMTFTAKLGEHGLWYITSPQHKGLFMAERDLSAGLAKAPTVLAELIEVQEEVRAERARIASVVDRHE